jgi:hypothetical protein
MDCRLIRAVLALMLVAVWSGTAHATDDVTKGAARDLANEAKRDFDAGSYVEAARKFQRAYEVTKVPMLAVWTARTLLKCNQLVAASELYRQATLLTSNDLWVGNAQQQAQADAARELAGLQPRIPKLRVLIDGAVANEVELWIDEGNLAPALLGFELPIDPGKRRVVGRRGTEVVEQTISLNEGERRDVILKFSAIAVVAPAVAPAIAPAVVATQPFPATPANQQPAGPMLAPQAPQVPQDGLPMASGPTLAETQPAPPSSSVQRTWGWVALGVGAAGLLTGVVAGIDVLTNSGLRDNCPGGTCDPSKVGSDSISSYNSMRTLSTVGFIVGGIGTAAGVTLLLWAPKQEQGPRAALWLGPSSMGVKGAF